MTVEQLRLAREIRDHLAELTGRTLPNPRTLTGLGRTICRIPLSALSEPQTRGMLACIALVRRARRARDQGDDARAVELLNEALQKLQALG